MWMNLSYLPTYIISSNANLIQLVVRVKMSYLLADWNHSYIWNDERQFCYYTNDSWKEKSHNDSRFLPKNSNHLQVGRARNNTTRGQFIHTYRRQLSLGIYFWIAYLLISCVPNEKASVYLQWKCKHSFYAVITVIIAAWRSLCVKNLTWYKEGSKLLMITHRYI